MSKIDIEGVGPREPSRFPPRRPPGSVRRTSSLDVRLGPDGAGSPRLLGRARDARTSLDGDIDIIGMTSIALELDEELAITRIVADPSEEAVLSLTGHRLPRGFRAAVAACLGDATATRLALLLDDVPMGVGLSNYARMAAGRTYQGPPAAEKVDICSGYREGGTLLTRAERVGRQPAPGAPLAPDLVAPDPHAWHALPALPAHSMRRIRQVQVAPGSPLRLTAGFRDSYMGADGEEVVVHEYSLEGTVDPRSLRLLDVVASPRVLPYPECPAAAASAATLSGRHVAGLRDGARRALRGTATCTHLTDLMAAVAGVDELARALDRDDTC